MVLKKRKLKSRPAKKTIRNKKITTKKPVLKKKKTIKKLTVQKKPVSDKSKDIIGVVTHYFPKVRAAVIKLKTALALGQKIRIKGHTTDFTQTVSSIQIDHAPVTEAKNGQEIGLLVNSRVRQHDLVYRV
ncbi:MAG: hypothetical protein NC923_06900 [Candidatus Omnitrophica bacterium]|nr:hypothetical protein [Candidatus Omnitrophota bacterium]